MKCSSALRRIASRARLSARMAAAYRYRLRRFGFVLLAVGLVIWPQLAAAVDCGDIFGFLSGPLCDPLGFVQSVAEDVADISKDIVSFDPEALFDDIVATAADIGCTASGSKLLGLLGGELAKRWESKDCRSSQPIESAVLGKLKLYFRASFDDVRIHTDCDFGDSGKAITFGEHIYFNRKASDGSGGYHPLCASGTPPCTTSTAPGDACCRDGLDRDGFAQLVHELTHVMQYRREGFDVFACKYALDCGLADFLTPGTIGVDCRWEQQAYIHQAEAREDVTRDADGVFTCKVGASRDHAHEWNPDNIKDFSCSSVVAQCGQFDPGSVAGAIRSLFCGDNCPDVYNPDQTDADKDGLGDACPALPITTAVTSSAPNANGWNNTAVTVTLSAASSPGGSAIKDVHFILTGATTGEGVVAGSSATVTIAAEGTTTLTYFAQDNEGRQEAPKTLTIRIDTTSPTITVVGNPTTLWPPNGKIVPVTVSGTITDLGSGVNTSTAVYAVTDEYGILQPSGSVAVGPSGKYSFTIQLEASRRGDDPTGRHYTINVRAKDNAGTSGAASADVSVPHDRR
jgi:hypothetical protein